uniref:Calmodulin binding transcription activator 1 n=1 Tax=Amphiprion percula TaxID=161767 RepID=A0A3P8U034_AMPPE
FQALISFWLSKKPVLNILFCLALVVDEHGHLKIYLPKKLLECLPKCTSLPKERHRWNTNEVRTPLLIMPLSPKSIFLHRYPSKRHAVLSGPFQTDS